MPTRLIRSLYNVTERERGGVITIGNFDGVHLGHQALIKKAKDKAQALGVPSIVLTFEPHPFEFFAREKQTIPRLTRLREKYGVLAQLGVDNVLVLYFNQSVARLDASTFCEKILYQALKPAALFVGDDFHFGAGRKGDIALLQEAGKRYGFTAEAIETVLFQGERISSTRVRHALKAGDHALVKQLLGRRYSMMGRVCPGDQLGRQLGFPTANIHLHRHLTPVMGIYTVTLHGIAEHPLPGVANVGIRPTVNGTRTLLEVHLLDFNQDIYGRYVTVQFCEKLRDEERYPNLKRLQEQIAKDVIAARHYFKKQSVL